MAEHQSLQNENNKKFKSSRVDQVLGTERVITSPQLNTEQSMLHLQRTIGNYAILKMLRVTPKVQTQKIQRADIGLEQSELSDSFVDNGYAYWSAKENKDKSVTDFASHLIKLVNNELAKFGIPPTKHDFRTSGSVGAFRKFEWMIYFNSDQLKEDGETVGALSQKAASDIADTVYHEARHAEQAFRIARMLAGEGKTAEEIASDIYVPADIAEKAIADPLKKTKDNAEEFAEAKDWYNMMAGIHFNYRMKMNEFGDNAFDTYKSISELKPENFHTTKHKITEFMKEVIDERAPWLVNEKKRLDEIPNPSDMDKNILGHVTKVFDESIQAIVKWDDGKVASDEASLQAMKEPIMNLWLATFNAYKEFAIEKDAWEVGESAGKKFENKKPEPVK